MESIRFNNYDVAYQTAGDPANPCIVCLHPAFGNHHTFDDQLKALSADYFLIAADMLGHGMTQPEKTNDKVDATIAQTKAILDQYQVKSAHLLGVSLGSLIAQGFAHQYPQRTKSVTVVGGYSIHKNNKGLMKTQNKAIFSWLFKVLFDMKGFRIYIAQQSTYLPKAYQRMLAYTQKITRKSFLYLQGMRKIFIENETPVPYPLLIVYGDHDLAIALEHGKEWAKIEPKAELVIIENAGHCTNMEQPEAFNKVFKVFMEKNS
jgi:pimeloyl-ACP methyl ester carboxylesterase